VARIDLACASELKRLRRENAILRQERDILKRATAFFAKEGSR
jgi:transposase